MINIILIFSFAVEVFSQFDFIDLNKCKLTRSGTEYVGQVSRSESNGTCVYWNFTDDLGSVTLSDKAFPDGSKVSAKNFCRNPTKDAKGPWCYTTMKSKATPDLCDVPFCKSTECRVSGPGMEYAGSIDTSISGKKCLMWTHKKNFFTFKKEIKLRDKAFPDGSAETAGRKCRNPDGLITGPWCYVEKKGYNGNDTELCDIPFCDDTETVMYSDGSLSGHYFFFSSLLTKECLNISVRLWNPSDWDSGQVFIYLGAYDVALDRQDNDNWKSGVEIMIGNSGSGILSRGSDDLHLVKTPSILSGAKWTDLHVKWTFLKKSKMLVEVYESTNDEPFAAYVFPINQTIFEIETFRFFSLAGSPSIWNAEFDNNKECFVHTVPRMNFTRFWLMKKITLGIYLDIFVRAKRHAVIILRSAPMIRSKQVEILIANRSKMIIATYDNENHTEQIKEVNRENIIDIWKWRYFRILVINNKISIHWLQRDTIELLMEANHTNIAGVLWVGFASSRVSYWTIYCNPMGKMDPPPAEPPECVTEDSEPFIGTLSVTKKGHQCIPWTDVSSIPKEYQDEKLFFAYGGKLGSANYCRNLNRDPGGAFCVVKDSSNDCGFRKEYCHPRYCGPGNCKMAGTGNDYLGKLNRTRSKRQCIAWSEVDDADIGQSYFPDLSIRDARNFCRNPTKSVTGCWCYTTDPKVPRDVCAVNDCDRPLETLILVTKFVKGISMYILPSWRKGGLHFWLKAWNPDVYEGLVISLMSIDSLKEYVLIIGDEENEKISFSFKSNNSNVLLRKRTLPHLVPVGKWAEFWLRVGYGKIELGYSNVKTSFFEWTSPNQSYSFEPAFMSYGTVQEYWIGVSFRPSECLTEITSMNKENKIYPITLWRNVTSSSNLTLNLRGSGSVRIVLMWTPDFNKTLGVEIDSKAGNVSIHQYSNESDPCELASYPISNAISEKRWTQYVNFEFGQATCNTRNFTENSLRLDKEKEPIFQWESSIPLLIYWFSVSAINGTIVWTANCPPSDIDGKPRDGSWGDWGPWSCSVTCGKGHGKVERECNNPPPNVFGKDCKGLSSYIGPCNDFPCGQITPDTHALIRRYLSKQHKSLEVDAKERVSIPCNPQIMPLIVNEVNDLNISWSHNGFKCGKTKFILDENFTLIIPHAQEKHNGVYLCTAYQGYKSIPQKVVLEVISLIVKKNKPNKKVNEGKSVVLKCNGLALAYVYADLSHRWELNGTTWKEYSIGALEMVMATTDRLDNVNDTHSGIWTCVVVQEDFKFKWITNWVNLKVKTTPGLWLHLKEYISRTPILGKTGNERNIILLFFCMIGILLVVILLLICVLVKVLRKQSVFKK